MQTYFNHDDAEIEASAAINGNPREYFFAQDFADHGKGGYWRFFITTLILGTFLFVMNNQLSTKIPEINISKPKLVVAHTFNVEIPEPKPPKVKKIPKKEITPPKDRKPLRRKKPQTYASAVKPEIKKSREIKTDEVREQINEVAAVREVPRIETPVIEANDFKSRENAAMEVRHVSVSSGVDTVRHYSYGGIEERHVPTIEVSHTQLDQYHYQMVNVCLRLCAQSLFLRSGAGIPEQKYPSDWLKVEKSNNRNSIQFKYNGSWLKLTINADRLTMLSDLSFVEIPANYASVADDIEELFSEVTKKLCRLLHHEDCLENL